MTEPPPETPPPLWGLTPAPVLPGLAEPRPGDRVGPYRLVRRIGAGAGGSVYEVLHEKLDRPAALKLLPRSQAARPAARARFLAEALAVNRIAHPNIVEVTDIVDTPEHVALVMELLEGRSLGAAMAEGPLLPEDFLPILAQVCEALAAAHAAGIVHRDLKPENVFLCSKAGTDQTVKLLDFGVAMAPSVTPEGSEPAGPPAVSSPRPATFVGTPAYASPEQASGSTVGRATDVYAIGVILYELACGRLPFEGWSAGQFVIQHLSAPVPRLPAELRATPLGRALDAVVQGCMAKLPGDRFGSAGELAAIFAGLARGEEIPISPGVPRLTPRRLGRRAVLAVGAAIALLALAIGVARHHASQPAGPGPAAPLAAQASGGGRASPGVVVVVFESRPAGAEVRKVVGGELLGVTPFRRAFPRSAEEWVVEVSRRGWKPMRLPVSMSASRALSVKLAPHAAKPEPRRPGRRSARALESDKTIDPFRRLWRTGIIWSR